LFGEGIGEKRVVEDDPVAAPTDRQGCAHHVAHCLHAVAVGIHVSFRYDALFSLRRPLGRRCLIDLVNLQLGWTLAERAPPRLEQFREGLHKVPMVRIDKRSRRRLTALSPKIALPLTRRIHCVAHHVEGRHFSMWTFNDDCSAAAGRIRRPSIGDAHADRVVGGCHRVQLESRARMCARR
jgi:hypothetical protein